MPTFRFFHQSYPNTSAPKKFKPMYAQQQTTRLYLKNIKQHQHHQPLPAITGNALEALPVSFLGTSASFFKPFF